MVHYYRDKESYIGVFAFFVRHFSHRTFLQPALQYHWIAFVQEPQFSLGALELVG
jgi:hypothetical protein